MFRIAGNSIGRLYACLYAALSMFAMAMSVRGASFEWANPADGFYTASGNWNPIDGTGPAPPGIGDMALFNENGSYLVTLSGPIAASDVVQVTAGDVTFKKNHVRSSQCRSARGT